MGWFGCGGTTASKMFPSFMVSGGNGYEQKHDERDRLKKAKKKIRSPTRKDSSE